MGVKRVKKKNKVALFDVINITFMVLFCFCALYPLIYVLAGAFNDGVDYMRGGVYFFPRKFATESFKVVFADKRLGYGFVNTIGRTVIGTITSLLFTAMVAYGISRKKLLFRNTYYWILIIPMFFGGGLVPYFLLLKNLNLLNKFAVYIIPSLFSVFNMIVMHSFFRELPEEIHESAYIDGAGEFRIFVTLILPLSPPILATIALWNAVGHWNSFFDSMLFTTKPHLMTLQLYLMKLIKEASMVSQSSDKIPAQVRVKVTVQTVRMAAIVVTMFPIMAIYPFLQKYFLTGVMVGSIKG